MDEGRREEEEEEYEEKKVEVEEEEEKVEIQRKVWSDGKRRGEKDFR